MKQMNYSSEENQLVQGKRTETFFFPNSSEKGAFLLGGGDRQGQRYLHILTPSSETKFCPLNFVRTIMFQCQVCAGEKVNKKAIACTST